MVVMTRRQAVMSLLFGAGGVGLRALATGIPASILLNPRLSQAASSGAAACADLGKAQYLILSTSYLGDPHGQNVPGMYLDPARGQGSRSRC
jgi:hypothetical protein